MEGINVLSLFDGISCGQIALERAGIKINKYFASEIDKHAIKVTQHNYPDTIQLGDVTRVKAEDLPKIDLLIGGSPCQGFSFAGKQLNFEDSRSKLFFEYVRLLRECKPSFFLLENVKMKRESEKVISEHLGVEPIEINSALVSAQNRRRLYWTNIPNVEQPEDKNIFLKDVLEDKPFDREFYEDKFKQHAPVFYKKEKYKCLVSQGGGRTKERAVCNEEREWRLLTRSEGEKLQTVSAGYTQPISENQTFKCLGNGWTVDVIAHIFKNIPESIYES